MSFCCAAFGVGCKSVDSAAFGTSIAHASDEEESAAKEDTRMMTAARVIVEKYLIVEKMDSFFIKAN